MLLASYRTPAQGNEWQILFGVLLLHAALYLLWSQSNAMHKDGPSQTNSGSLIFLNQPEQMKLTPRSPATQDLTERPRLGKVVPVPRHSSGIGAASTATVSDKEQSTLQVEKDTASSGNEIPVNRDTREIFNGLKKDFQYRDQVSTKAAPAPMEKFGAAVKSSSTVMRESYKHEVHILGDGRPVSKVITPFGTYCILHRKPGEIIGNELATIPVTCGNL